MNENPHRRESDTRGFNGWLLKWGDPANIARLLGAFLAVIFGAFTLVIGGYAWNMKIDGRSVDNESRSITNERMIESVNGNMLEELQDIRNELGRIREKQIEIHGEIKRSTEASARTHNSLIRHGNKRAHDGQLSETARTNALIGTTSASLQDLKKRVLILERNTHDQHPE